MVYSQSLASLSSSTAMMASLHIWRLCRRHQKAKSSCDHDLRNKVRMGFGLVLLPLQQPWECHRGFLFVCLFGLRTPVVCGGLRLTKDGTYATQTSHHEVRKYS